MKQLKWAALVAAAVMMTGCGKIMEETIKSNPDIVFNAIKENPKKFIDVVNEAARKAQETAREDEAKAESGRLEEEFKNPKQPTVDDKRIIYGKAAAPITIVEYSDFECPFCSRGYMTIKEVVKEYGDKVKVIFKNLPLDFHPQAMPAARYFEAVAMQGMDKAAKFHDDVFMNQKDLKADGEKFLKAAARKAGADMSKLAKDLDSEAVKAKIAADMEEAKKFEFAGTPGFLINGVSLRGAYPFPEFKKIIDRHLASAGGAAAPAKTEEHK